MSGIRRPPNETVWPQIRGREKRVNLTLELLLLRVTTPTSSGLMKQDPNSPSNWKFVVSPQRTAAGAFTSGKTYKQSSGVNLLAFWN